MFLLPRNLKKRMTRKEADEIIERSKDEAPLELEKGDLKAIILAAIIVFVPFILILTGTLLLFGLGMHWILS